MSKPILLKVKILSIQYAERYVVRRLVMSAQQELQEQYPRLEVDLTEVGGAAEIGKYAFVLVLPSLVINDKIVCTGRCPAKEEVVEWLREAAGLSK